MGDQTNIRHRSCAPRTSSGKNSAGSQWKCQHATTILLIEGQLCEVSATKALQSDSSGWRRGLVSTAVSPGAPQMGQFVRKILAERVASKQTSYMEVCSASRHMKGRGRRLSAGRRAGIMLPPSLPTAVTGRYGL